MNWGRREKIREEKESEEGWCRCAKRYIEKSRVAVFFPMFCGSGGSKSRLAKAVSAEPSGEMRDQKLHAVVARNTFRSQTVKSTSCLMLRPLLEVEMSKKRTWLWGEANLEVKMLKTHQLRSTFGSWDWCSKTACCCGAKHISKWKCTKCFSSGALLEVESWKAAQRCGAKNMSKSNC